jgi:hypothetical protein
MDEDTDAASIALQAGIGFWNNWCCYQVNLLNTLAITV